MSKFTRVRAVSGAAHEFDAPLALVLSHPERYERVTDSEDVDKPRPPAFKPARTAAYVDESSTPTPAKPAEVKKTAAKAATKPAGAKKEEVEDE